MSEKDGNDMEDWESAMAEQAAEEAAAQHDKSAAAGPADWGDAMAEQMGAVPVDKHELEDLQEEQGHGPSVEDTSLDVILDIPVSISLEVGNTKISIRNLLKLNQGSVVELDRLAGEPLDVLVNGTLIAHAEVVVVNEKYGIRLTDVISAAERIQKLK